MINCDICEAGFPDDKLFPVSYYDNILDEKSKKILTVCIVCLPTVKRNQLDFYYNQEITTLPSNYQCLEDGFGDWEKAERLKNESLFLYGSPGCGKTALATFILRILWQEGKMGLFVRFSKLIYKVQIDFMNSLPKIEAIEKYKGCLVLDDIGTENLTKNGKTATHIMIDSRASNGLQTIITSNYDLDEIGVHFGDKRIPSRIAGMITKKASDFSDNGDRRIKG